MTIPILFVRYAPGACGTFLLTVLSSSDGIACWSTDLEQQKHSANFSSNFFEWFQSKFTQDLDQHLKHEPHHPYKLDFFSAKYHRGDDISVQTFMQYLVDRDDQHFLHNISQRKLTPMRLNKSVVPNFGHGSSIVNIFIDAASRKWLHRARFIKLFGRDREHFVLKEQHPEFLKAKKYPSTFNNPYLVQDSHHGFVKKYVINDATVSLMADKSAMIGHESNSYCDQHWVNLSELLHPESAAACMLELAKKLDITLDQDLVSKCCQHYYDTNVKTLITKRACGFI